MQTPVRQPQGSLGVNTVRGRRHGLRYVVYSVLLVWAFACLAEETQRPHAYEFAQPELVSTQRVFGVGHAVTLLAKACVGFPEVIPPYQIWRENNAALLQQMTATLATHYRIAPVGNDLQGSVAQAMYLSTDLALTEDALATVCPTLPETLMLPSMDLLTRYRESVVEVSDPNYFKRKRQGVTVPPSLPEDKHE